MSTPNDEKTNQAPVREHVADGIQEYDNPLPRWWVGLFYACTVFAVAYLAYYHVMGGSSLLEELNESDRLQKAAVAEQTVGDAGVAGGEDLDALIADPKQVSAGKELFVQNCAPCHGPSGEGLIGPNLTDKFWLHGGKPEAIRRTISQGVPEKGMIAWQPILNNEKIIALTAFIVSIRGTNPPNAKAPQGNEEP